MHALLPSHVNILQNNCMSYLQFSHWFVRPAGFPAKDYVIVRLETFREISLRFDPKVTLFSVQHRLGILADFEVKMTFTHSPKSTATIT